MMASSGAIGTELVVNPPSAVHVYVYSPLYTHPSRPARSVALAVVRMVDGLLTCTGYVYAVTTSELASELVPPCITKSQAELMLFLCQKLENFRTFLER